MCYSVFFENTLIMKKSEIVMKTGDFIELFFIIAAGLAMPFIVIGSYFNFVPSGGRYRPLTIFFLIVSIIYAILYSYFA